MKEFRNKAVGAAGNGGVAENSGVHPKRWVVRLVEGRGLVVGDKTLYWWSVHLERSLKFCQSAGAGSSEIPEVAVRLFLESLPVGSSAQEFARDQARMALDVFLSEVEGWSWGEDRYGRVGPKFRLKTSSAGLTTEDTGGTERVLAKDRVHGIESPWKSDSSASHPYPGVSLGAAAPRAERIREALEAMRRALRVRHYALRTEESYVQWMGRFLDWLGRRDGDLEQAGEVEVRAFLEELAVGGRVLSFKN